METLIWFILVELLLVLIVHFRVVTLDPDLRPVSSLVSVLILGQY